MSQSAQPLLFDTCVAWKAGLLKELREKYKNCAFLLPSLVIFERTRKLRIEHGRHFDQNLIDQFLKHEFLRFEIVPFDEKAAHILAELTASFGTKWTPTWPTQERNVAKNPCGERCRLADHCVTAMAKRHKAVLVTEDQQIITVCKNNSNFFPRFPIHKNCNSKTRFST